MEVNQTIPSLVNGVSQQAPELRHDTTVDEMINCTLSFTEGTRRRHPLEYVATDNVFLGHTPFIHTYERGDGTEAYMVTIYDGNWRVYDLNGVLQDSGTDAYLDLPAGAVAAESFSAVTVGDTTFIVNKTKTVLESSTYTHGTTDQNIHKSHAYYWVKRSYISYGGADNADIKTYSYTINGTTKPTNGNEEYGRDSEEVASALATAIGGSSSGSIVYKNTTGNWDTSDSWGNQASQGWQGRLKKLQDLPNTMGSYSGVQTLVNVTGDQANKFEGFWSWVENRNDAWTETVAPGITDGFQKSTMPHILQRVAIGDFTFGEFAYEGRDVGDDTSNSMPSFVGKEIQDIFFYRNRLGFIAQDNIIMSETGIYENFFRTTVTDLLDTDPIDVAVDTNSVANLKYAVPFNQNLLVFGTHAQYILGAEKTLTPDSASLSQTTTYPINQVVKPKPIGPNVYFAIDRGDFSQIREYYNVPGSTSNEATDITSHVPTYIDHSLTTLEVSPKYDMVFCLPINTNEIYVYNQTWEGEEKSQSAWHRWEIADVSIINIQVVGDYLFVVYLHNSEMKLGKINLKSEDFTTITYIDATGTYESNFSLNEWGFQSGGQNKVDDKKGRLQIRKIELEAREGSVQDIDSTVGTNTKTHSGDSALVLGNSKKTSIKIKSTDSDGFCIDSINLTGRFSPKTRTV